MNPDILQSIQSMLKAGGLAAILSQPWAVSVPMLAQEMMAGRIRIGALDGVAADRRDPNALRMYEDVGVAVQPVQGVIYPGATIDDEFWDGLFNTDRIHSACAAVAANPAIKTLVFRMNTPGGSVFGLDPAAKSILALKRQRKDMNCVAWVGHLCASAGMYLAAACDSIHAAPGAVVGSIGTIASLTDTSGLWEKLGMKKHLFTADGSLKGMGAGGIAPSAEHIAHMENMVASYSKEFKSWMTKRRDLKPGDMLGQIFEARKAPSGMVDTAAFLSMEQMLSAGLAL